MQPIDVSSLPPLPAPFWFVELFKVLGFTLHAIPMNLWYAGILVTLICGWRCGEHGRRLVRRFMIQMPIVVALGINLGIVPLLFLQLAYGPVFYSATILMAWYWLSIVVLVIPAYYGVYVYASALRANDGELRPWQKAAGWVAVAAFVLVGFFFANGLSLMTNTSGWMGALLKHNVAGAATGTSLNHGDPTLIPRWLLMFGLALGTTAAWIAMDSGCFANGESAEYRRWSARLARIVAVAGAMVAMSAGVWYVFGAWRPEVFRQMLAFADHPILTCLALLTASSPWWTAGLLWFWGGGELTPRRAAAIVAAQTAVLAVNAVSRQIVQNIELGIDDFFLVGLQETKTDWGPLLLFLGTFVGGVGAIGWMLAQLRKATPEESV
jgi:hypothetical protein